MTARVGISQKDSNPATRRGSRYAQLMVDLTPEVDRERPTAAIIKELKEQSAWLLQPDSRKRLIQESGLKTDPLPGAPAKWSELSGQLEQLEIDSLDGGPPVYGLGGYDPFLLSMALALASGLVFAISLTLILIPVLYYLTEKKAHQQARAEAIEG